MAVVEITTKPWRAVDLQDIGGRECPQQAATIRQLAGRYNRAAVLLDSTSRDQMVDELTRNGIKTTGFKFTNESKRELIDGLVLALERGDMLIPRHPDLLKELTYYRFQTTPSGTVKLGAPAGTGHFDYLLTTLALAVQEAKRPSLFRHEDILAALSHDLPPEDWLFGE